MPARRIIDGLAADLTATIGPNAMSVLARAAAQATTLEELCRLAAAEIADPFTRQVFIEKAAARIAGQGNAPMPPPPAPSMMPPPAPSMMPPPAPSPLPTSIPTQVVDRATRALAEFIGPIARVHVRNALAVSPTQDQFLRALANHLDTETERGQFLAKARSG